MKVVRIINCSNGNETVGEMWNETKIFDSEQPIKDLFKEFLDPHGYNFFNTGKKYIHLSIPTNEKENA